MADIAASDVTHTVVSRARTASQGINNEVTIAFGNGVLTYPSGGVPLTGALMGCPNVVSDFDIVDAGNANGFLYKWDKTNNKIRIYQGDNTNAAAAPAIELVAASATPAAATLKGFARGY